MSNNPELELEVEHHLAELETPVGLPGSGYQRYASAMYLFTQGRMSAELLEVYRVCCKLDDEDPRRLARHEGIT